MIDMTKQHEKNATLKMSLKADSGYSCKQEARISAHQWGEISRILNEPAPPPAAGEQK